MKTNMNPVFFLYRNRNDKTKKRTENKENYEIKTAMICRQLLYESTANDIYWVFQPKRHIGLLENVSDRMRVY